MNKNRLISISLTVALSLLAIFAIVRAASITTINGSDTISSSRTVINTNFSNLNSAKLEHLEITNDAGTTYARISSLSFEQNMFDLTTTASQSLIRLDWTNGPASRSQANTWSNLQTFTLGASSSLNFEVSGYASASSFKGPLTGNASTATALAADPADCSSEQWANSINASGTLGCALIPLDDLTDLNGSANISLGDNNLQFSAGGTGTLSLVMQGTSGGNKFTIDQNAGDQPAGTHLLHIEAADPDVHLLHLAQHAASTSMALHVSSGRAMFEGGPVSVSFNNLEVVGAYASASQIFGGVASHQFSGSFSGRTTGTLSVGTSNNPLKILWSNIIKSVVQFFFPTTTSTVPAISGEAIVNTASGSLEVYTGAANKILSGKRCFTYVVDAPTSANPGKVGPIRFNDPFTITSVQPVASGSNAAGWNLRYGSPGSMTTSVFTLSKSASTSSYPTYTSFANSTVKDGNSMELNITSRSATLQTFSVSVCGLENH